ncbi:MAG TPA: F0F1 ATP synthase subunit delta [Thiobacillaceae bacterium]|nr:F0F1 ATP synthase subunit delta [Thiobacillaceae bacterium]
MAELTTIARPYAEAVARMAAEGNAWGKWSGMLAALAAVSSDPQVADLAGNPAVPGDTVAEIILGVCGDRLDNEGANLTRMLVENKRLVVLPEMARLFEDMKARQEGLLEAHVTTAFELSGEQLSALVGRLEQKFARKVTATQSVDPELIGGVIIAVGDEVMDASVRGKLSEMAATLKA